MKILFSATIISAVLSISTLANAFIADTDTALLVPANALVAPFDATSDHQSYALASNTSDSTDVSTHWSFWGEDCTHLADVSICLTRHDTIVVDVTDIHAVSKDNKIGGTAINLTGKRGTIVATAFETNDDCDPAVDGTKLVEDVIVGSFHIANTKTGASFGGNMLGLGTDGGQTVLPLASDQSPLTIQTFRPDTLTDSEVILLAMREGAGAIAGEVGPLNGKSTDETLVRAGVSFFDTTEVRTSLPDVEISCALFTSMIDGLIPSTITPSSSGVVELSDFNLITDGVVSSDTSGVFVYGFHGQEVGRYATMNYATFRPGR